jgi:hypothetical protein
MNNREEDYILVMEKENSPRVLASVGLANARITKN